MALLLVSGVATPFMAQDKKPKGDTKTTVTSGHFKYSLKLGQAVYTDNVAVVDPQIDIFTDKMTVIFAKKKPKGRSVAKDRVPVGVGKKKEPAALKPLGGIGGNVDRIICEGRVIIVNKKDKATATGDRAVYTAATELVVITGNARLKNEQGILLGKVIEYDRRTGDLTAAQSTTINEGKDKEKKPPTQPEKPKGQ